MMTRNEFVLLNTIRQQGAQSCRKLGKLAGLSVGYVSQTLREFAEEGLADSDGITEKGMKALLPYKVDNAIIEKSF